MNKRKLLALLLALVMCLGLTAPALASSPTSGNCGAKGHETSVTWEVTANGKKVSIYGTEHDAYTLTIRGTGAMDDFNHEWDEHPAPWQEQGYDDYITDVIVESGVTSVGAEAFGSGWSRHTLDNLTSVTLADTVTKIGNWAFASAKKLKTITLPDSVTSIGSGALPGFALESFEIGANIEELLNGGGLSRCPNITLSPENQNFTFVDGVLYNKGVTEVVLRPESLNDTSWNVPQTVRGTYYVSNWWLTELQNITCPSGFSVNFDVSPNDGNWYFDDGTPIVHLYFENDSDKIDVEYSDGDWLFPGGYLVRFEVLPYTLPVQEIKFDSGYVLGNADVVYDPDVEVYVGQHLTNRAINSSENGGAITYASSNENIATVDATTGEVTVRGVGHVVITATAAGVDGKWAETKVSYCLFTSSDEPSAPPTPEKTALAKSMFTVDTAEVTHTGSAITKTITSDLVLDTDYTVAYADNVNVGTAKITITGIGNYTGTLEYTFTIKAASTTGGNTGGSTDGSTGGSTTGGSTGGSGGGSTGGSSGGSATPAEPEAPVEPETPTEPESPATPASEVYGDVEKGSWYEEGVTFVTDQGLFQGVSEGVFAPQQNMTRAMLMTVLARLDGQETEGGETWYAKAMNWAMEQGISDGSQPNGNITREQLAVMLYRYAGNPEGHSYLTVFKDGSEVSAWAQDAMEWAVSSSILTGKDGGRLDPQGTATRAEVATVIRRFVENTQK